MSIEQLKLARVAFIENIKEKVDISHFQGAGGEAATWDDVAWTYIDSTGQSHNFYFTQDVVRRFSSASSRKTLPRGKKLILMAYALHLISDKTSTQYKTRKVSVARSFIYSLESIDDISTDTLATLLDDKPISVSCLITTFVKWLIENNLIYHGVHWTARSPVMKTGDEVAFANKEKLPNDKVIMALGCILYDVINPDESKWQVGALNFQRDALVCAMTVLAMSSPNRVTAEQTILNSQVLKSHSQIENSVKKTVHYLDWKGSKGFKDYKNHILAGMAPTVERVLEYTQRVTEPARVLARFYVSPKAPLKDILLEFSPSQENLSLLNPDMSKPINMLTLGMLLGFYEGTDKSVQVPKFTNNAKRVKYKRYWSKHIKDLMLDDVICIPRETSLKKLIGVLTNSETYKVIFSKRNMTISDFQKEWIAHINKGFSKFPLMSNGTKEGEVDMRVAMFAITGNQIVGQGAQIGTASFYYIMSPESLGVVFYDELRKTTKRGNSIFSRNGFGSEFYITPHQFRHYLNDCAERNGVPRQIINLWSGRKSPDQIMNYVHRTGAERTSEISDIQFAGNIVSESEAVKSIRVVSKDEYELLTDSVATETSSGVCVQNLTINPCSYLNNFETQCTLCASSCHVAHDMEAISLLEKDLEFQQKRLDKVQNHQRFLISQAMQSWFKVHYKNTEILNQLVMLMKDSSIKQGSFIRLVSQYNEFRITDLQRKAVTVHQLELPDENQALQKALEVKTPKPESEFEDLLGMI